MNYIKALFTDWGYSTEDWVDGVSSNGTIVCSYKLGLEQNKSRIPVGWTIQELPRVYGIKTLTINGKSVKDLFIDGRKINIKGETPDLDYLCFTAEEPRSTIMIGITGTAPTAYFQYSKNKSDWFDYTTKNVIQLDNIGDKIYFRAKDKNGALAKASKDRFGRFTFGGCHYFIMTGKFSADGKVLSLLDKNIEDTVPLSSYAYGKLFAECSSLVTAPEICETEVKDGQYYHMFENCTSLVKAPSIPNANVITGG